MNLESLKTRTTRYKAKDGVERAVMRWRDYESLLDIIVKRDALVLHMLNTIEHLGRDRMAMIDSRLWETYYTRRARRLGIGKRKKK